MRFTLDNGKVVTIPDDEIKQSKNALGISTKEAVEMWLDDNGYTTNEEQAELDEKAKEVKVNFVDAREVKAKKERKPVVKKVSDEKKMLFDSIVQQLDRCELVERENVTILNENKLIQVKIGNKTFKIDLIECRPPKKQAVCDQNSQKMLRLIRLAEHFRAKMLRIIHYNTLFNFLSSKFDLSKCTKIFPEIVQKVEQ